VSTTTNPFPTLSLIDSLRALHEEYVYAVNFAVAEERLDLVDELAAEYPGEAMALMARVLPVAA
jgi:hypothetical protein